MAVDTPVSGTAAIVEAQVALSRDWRRLIRFATFIAVLTSPSVFIWYHHNHHWSFAKTLFVTFMTVLAFRGLVELIVRRYIPWPSLFGSEDKRLHEEDVSGVILERKGFAGTYDHICLPMRFEAWRKGVEQEDPKRLFLKREDLMRHEAAGITTEQFPHHLEMAGRRGRPVRDPPRVR